MENEKSIHTLDLVGALAIAGLGFMAVHYLLSRPDKANYIYLRGCLLVKRSCQRFSDGFQVVADRAGTEYNKRRLPV